MRFPWGTGGGAAAYLDVERLLQIAAETKADTIHPGYGFLSESADFARRARNAGLNFVGPTTEQLETFGDKVRARQLAREMDVPVLDGTKADIEVEQVEEFLEEAPSGAIMIKAAAGAAGAGHGSCGGVTMLPKSSIAAQAKP